MNEKSNFKFVVFACVIVLFVLLCTITRNKNGADTEGAISDIRKQQQSVKVEIGNIDSNLGEARRTVTSASERAFRVQKQLNGIGERLTEHQREVNNLSKLARECKEIADRNGAILEEIREKNQ